MRCISGKQERGHLDLGRLLTTGTHEGLMGKLDIEHADINTSGATQRFTWGQSGVSPWTFQGRGRGPDRAMSGDIECTMTYA